MDRPHAILIIEDNPGDQLLLQENLTNTSLVISEISTADSLAEAVNLLRQHSFSLIFLDLFLPDSAGLESIIELLKTDAKTPVIISSGLADSQIALKAISLGAQDFLIKGDYDNKLLEKTVRYSIERKRNLEIIQESNERFNLVSKATNDMVWDWNVTTGEVYRNKERWAKIFKEENETPGKTIADFDKRVHPDDLKRVKDLLRKLFYETINENLFEAEFRILRGDGSYGFLYDRGYIIRDEEGRPLRVIGASQDITERKLLEEKAALEKIIRQKEITEAVVAAQESERSEIGRELHDNVNQLLGAARLYIDMARRSDDNRDSLLVTSSKYTLQAIEEIRKLSKTLITPLIKEIGLTDAIENLSENIMLVHPIRIKLITENFTEEPLNEKFKLNLFRIVQEQLNNILKHAKATNVAIGLTQTEDEIRLAIIDDGVGFDTTSKKKGLGLMNIKSRAELYKGNIDILSEPGHGCTLSISFKKSELLS